MVKFIEYKYNDDPKPKKNKKAEYVHVISIRNDEVSA